MAGVAGHRRRSAISPQVFEEKSFAIALLLLMITSALPIPTGGITTVFELIAMLLTLEMIFGRTDDLAPAAPPPPRARSGHHDEGDSVHRPPGPLLRAVRAATARGVLEQRVVLSALGVIILLFTLGPFVAPPFSGLDTLPALGVVVIALSLILEDAVITIVGIVIGRGRRRARDRARLRDPAASSTL